ncbi:Alpha-tubulin N-acetyltransferase 1 [Actinomortierella ambigua]|uniref:Alpha-tubulin N-acetyltransferase n=1 Tax=Actinomortierella ambigua TaxID=1343610 RepID=A0A9P6PY96_9FUNG|nr:Alpha-tubulin N-acetyltransferase 1 [Actinomortierella ambigua]
MEFDFPLLPLLPRPITLVPASSFAELERQASLNQTASATCSAFTSNVMIGSSSLYSSTSPSSSSSLTSSSYFGSSYGSSTMGSSMGGTSVGGGVSSSTGSAALSDLEKLGLIVDALGEASAKAQDLPSSITQRLRLARNPSQRVYIIRSGVLSEESALSKEGSDTSLCTSHLEGTGPTATTHDTTEARRQLPQQQQQQQPKNRDEGGGSIETGLFHDESGALVTGMLKMGEKKLFIVDRFGVMHEQEACCVLDFYVNETCQRQGYGKQLFDYMLKTEDISPEQIAYDRPSPKLYQFLEKHFGLTHHVPQPNQFAIFEGFRLEDTGEILQATGTGSGNDNTGLADWQTIGRRSSPASVSSNQSNSDMTSSYSTQPSSSSSSFNNGCMAQPFATFGQRPLSFHQQYHQQPPPLPPLPQTQVQAQQPNRRISSAFTSSIQLGDISDKSPVAAVQQPSRRISSAYTSSIDLSHPSALSALP